MLENQLKKRSMYFADNSQQPSFLRTLVLNWCLFIAIAITIITDISIRLQLQNYL